MEITKDIVYVGVNDHDVDLFEGQYKVPNGMAYNSYLIQDEKVAVMDSVDAHFTDAWLTNIAGVLGGRTPDYLVVQHMEPDHCALLGEVIKVHPDLKIVCTQKTVAMIKQFFDFEVDSRVQVVKEGDILNTGTHELQFIMAPMVHWPEVMITYDKTCLLYTSDAADD